MNNILKSIQANLNLSLAELIFLCFLGTLFLLIPFFASFVKHNNNYNTRIRFARLIIAVLFALTLFDSLILEEQKLSGYSKIVGTGLILFIATNCFNLVDILIRRKFGLRHIVDGQEVSETTYSSRVFTLSFGLLIAIISIIAILHVLGLRNLLEAGGVIGFIGVLFALTQASWAPDIIGGLVLMGTKAIKEGDIIEFFDGKDLVFAKVFRTKFFHTEILDLINNNRIFVPNHRLRMIEINNLSRLASPKGIREKVDVVLAYDLSPRMVEEALKQAFLVYAKSNPSELKLEFDPEVRITNCDPSGVIWSLFFYVKQARAIPEIKSNLYRFALEQLQTRNIRAGAQSICVETTKIN